VAVSPLANNELGACHDAKLIKVGNCNVHAAPGITLKFDGVTYLQCIGITFHTILNFLFYSGHNMKITNFYI